MEKSLCQICGQNNWEIINHVNSGNWNKNKQQIHREKIEFPIGICHGCNHTQIAINYTEKEFNILYFSNTSEPDMWCSTPINHASPYDGMLDFFSDKVNNNSNIVDFGCGAGATLRLIKNKYTKKHPSLTGVDFHNHIKPSGINFIEADLNNLQEVDNRYWPNGIDIAISTHVLEHVINPIKFLRNISSQLSYNGIIFIEVPDCSRNTSQKNLAFTNLVHGQHIHYYTKDSLAIIAEKSGLEILKIKQLQTGDIPRLQVLMINNSGKTKQAGEKIKHCARKVVSSRFDQVERCLSKQITKIKHMLNNEDQVGLWGIGGDFCLLLDKNKELEHLIKSKKLIMFDQELASHEYLGQPIYPSNDILDFGRPTIMIPLYGPTRERMKAASLSWPNVIDPFLG